MFTVTSPIWCNHPVCICVLLILHFININTGFELPEEDRDDPVDVELPRLPPDKDPQTQTLTRPQPKKKGQDKAMVAKLNEATPSHGREVDPLHNKVLSCINPSLGSPITIDI